MDVLVQEADIPSWADTSHASAAKHRFLSVIETFLQQELYNCRADMRRLLCKLGQRRL